MKIIQELCGKRYIKKIVGNIRYKEQDVNVV